MDEWRYCRALCEDDGELPELLLLSHECPELQDKVATIPRRREGPDLPRLADRRRRLRPRDADGRAPLSRVRRVRRAAPPGVRLEQDAVLGGVLDGAGRERDPRSGPGWLTDRFGPRTLRSTKPLVQAWRVLMRVWRIPSWAQAAAKSALNSLPRSVSTRPPVQPARR